MDNVSTPPLPFSAEAEKALLGAVMIEPGIAAGIDLVSDAFYVHRHRWVWEAIKSLEARGVAPDFVTVGDELERAGNLEEAGGHAWLTRMLNETPSFLNAAEYAAIIRDKHRRRKALESAHELARAAYDDGRDIEESLSSIAGKIAGGVSAGEGARHVSHWVNEVAAQVAERAANPLKTWGIPTGFKDFDRVTGGLHRSQVLYIAGEPGIGKSILAMQMAAHAAEAGYPFAIYSLEMRAERVAMRLLSARAQVDTRKMRTGEMTDDDFTAFERACREIDDLPLYISDKPGMTTAQVRADLARLVSQCGVVGNVLDYMFLLGDNGTDDPTARTEQLSARYVTICRELDQAGIGVNSVTKEFMDKGSSGKRGMRGSGQLIHDADTVVFLTKDPKALPGSPKYNIRTLAFEKGRDLEIEKAYIELIKRPGYPAFGDLEVRAIAGNNGAAHYSDNY